MAPASVHLAQQFKTDQLRKDIILECKLSQAQPEAGKQKFSAGDLQYLRLRDS